MEDPGRRPHETGVVTIGGKDYPYRAPKVAVMMSALIRSRGKSQIETAQNIAAAQVDSLRQALGSDGWADVEARLSSDDPLDWDDLVDAYQYVTGESSGRPTTSSAASSGQSSETSLSEEKPKPAESIFGS